MCATPPRKSSNTGTSTAEPEFRRQRVHGQVDDQGQTDADEGVAEAVIAQWTKHDLPLLLQIKEEMDAGRELTEGEIELLGPLLERARDMSRLAHLDEKSKELVAKIIDLIQEIIDQAVQNENKSTPE